MGNSSNSRLKGNDSGNVKPSEHAVRKAKSMVKTPTCSVTGRRWRRGDRNRKESSRPLLVQDRTKNARRGDKNRNETPRPLLIQDRTENAPFSPVRCFIDNGGMPSSSSPTPPSPTQNMSPVSNSSDSDNTKATLNLLTSFSSHSIEMNGPPNSDFADPTSRIDSNLLNDPCSNAVVQLKTTNMFNSPLSPLKDEDTDEGIIIAGRSSPQHRSNSGTIEARNDTKELIVTRPMSTLDLFSDDQEVPESPPPIPRCLMYVSEINNDIPPLPMNATPNLVADDTEPSENTEPFPSTYHDGGDNDQHSLNSESLLSTYSTDLESIGNLTTNTSLSDLSLSSSIASLNLKRRKRRTPPQSPQLKNSRLSSSKRLTPGRQKKRRGSIGRPTANNAFETLPRHLIKSALVRQATATLRDERFVKRRIVKLGPAPAAKIHASDLMYLHKRDVKDSRRRETLGVEAAVPDCSTFRDGECAMSVTLESFDLFQKCILELCSIVKMECEFPNDDVAACGNLRPSSAGGVKSENDTIAFSDGGKAIYLLGKCVQGKEWNEEAILYYRSALFLLLMELEIREPTLLDDSGDCTGFFYVRIANAGVDVYSIVHKDIATVLTKIGDIHGKNDEVNDALHAYRASQVFWKRYISEKKITSVIDCECVEDMADLDDHAAAVEGLALTHNRIGGVYCSKGDLSAALNSFNEAMEMQLKALGPDHLEVAKTLHNIGVSHRHSKDLDKALEYYNQALRIFELNLGKEHLDTVRTLHNIGGVYRRQKEYDKAMSCFRDVLKVRRTLLGDSHPSVSITLVSIAAVLRRSGKVEEANTYYSEAMK